MGDIYIPTGTFEKNRSESETQDAFVSGTFERNRKEVEDYLAPAIEAGNTLRQNTGINIPDNIIYTAFEGIKNGAIQNEDQYARWILSNTMARELGITPDEANENLEDILRARNLVKDPEALGKPGSLFDILGDIPGYLKNSHHATLRNFQNIRIQISELQGEYETAEKMRKERDVAQGKHELYNQTHQELGWLDGIPVIGRIFQKSIMFTAENAEYMASLFLANAVTGGWGSIPVGMTMVQGSIYETMRETAKLSPQMASAGALFAAYLSAYIEQSGGVKFGGNDTLLGKAVSNAGQRIVARMALSGVFSKPLVKAVVGAGSEMFSEGMEELLTRLETAATQEILADVENSFGGNAEPPNWREETLGAVEEFFGGVYGSVFFGLGGIASNLVAKGVEGKEKIGEMRRDALIMDKESFVGKHKNSDVLRGDEKKKFETLDKIYDSVSRQREREEAALAAEAKKEFGLGTGFIGRDTDENGEPVSVPVYRKKNGELYIQDDKQVKNGKQSGTYKAGDASRETSRNLGGYIDYEIDGGAVRITGMKVDPNYESVTGEFFQRFAKDFADYDIRWETEDETQAALRDRLIGENGRGGDYGLNYFEAKSGVSLDDQRTDQAVSRQFREQDPRTSPEQMGVVNSMVRAAGRYLAGTETAADGWRALGFDPDNIFTGEISQKAASEYYTAHERAWGANGITRELVEDARAGRAAFTPGQISYVKNNINGFITSLKEHGRKVIYLSKNGNFSTMLHEVAHAVTDVMPENLKRQAEAALGITDGNWTRANYEELARQMEGWAFRGETPNAAIRPVLEKMARFMREVYQSIKQIVAKENPELYKLFDELFKFMDSEAENGGISGAETSSKTFENAREGAAVAPEGGKAGLATSKGQTDVSGQYPGLGGRVDSGPVQAEGYDDIDAWVATLPAEQRENYRRNKALNESRESLAKNDKKIAGQTDPNLIIEGVGEENLEGLKAAARNAYPKIRETAQRWAGKYNGEVKGRPVPEGMDPDTPMIKGDARAIEKHEKEKTPYNQMLDMVGFTVVVDDMATLLKMAKEVISEGGVARAKDRYLDPAKGSYRDFLLNIRTEDGFVGEIQLNIRQMFDAKEAFGGHALYEVTRNFDTEISEGNITQGQAFQEQNTLSEISDKFYGKAYGLTLAGSEANATSLDMTSPSFQAYTSIKGVGDKVLSSFTMNKLNPLLAKGWSRHQTNDLIDGSSTDDGTDLGSRGSLGSIEASWPNAQTGLPSTVGTGLRNGTTLSGENASETGASSSATSATLIPSTTSIGQSGENVKGNVDISGISAIRERYRGAARTEGWEDTKNVAGQEIEGRWVLVEAETPTASHDEETFSETEGFPRNNGKSVNDRDYKKDRAAQEAVITMAADYDGRALEGIVVSDDGIVISGNNRTMSGKLAARNGTDGAYIEALTKKSRKYGFTAEQVAEFDHPRLVFETAVNGEYSTEQFARFNQATRKSMTPLETAVKTAKRLAEKPEVTKKIAGIINEHETIAELYNDKKAAREIFKTLREGGFIGEYELPRYMTESGVVTGAGEDLLESVMLGGVLTEDNIRGIEESKDLRRKLVRGITPLMENKGMGAYSLAGEVNEAVAVVAEVKRGKTFGTVEDYASQQVLLDDEIPAAKRASIQIARALESGGQRDFFDWMSGLNGMLAGAAAGQADMFAGTVESKETILDRYVRLIEGRDNARKENARILKDPAAGMATKAEAALDDAGMARGETLFQTIGEQGAAAMDRAEETPVRLDNLSIARQMETAGKDAKAVRLATGWERGADGKWRYEIPDVEFKDNSAFTTKSADSLESALGNEIIADDLFKAYPQLKDIKFLSVLTLPGIDGSFNEYGIRLSRLEGDLTTRKSILVHEIQHAIQDIEGFARGSNPEYFSKKQKQDAETALGQIMAKYSDDTNRALDEQIASNSNALRYEHVENNSEKANAEMKRAASLEKSLIKTMGEDNYQKARRLKIDLLNYGEGYLGDAENAYTRTAGEVEARNVQNRMGFTPRQRLETLLAETEDVAREDQIFLTEGIQIGAALDDAGMSRGETLFQENAGPVETLINRASALLDDLGDRETVIGELRELERVYPPEANRYQAPNGKPSLLLESLGEDQGRQAWYAVRTPSFKSWFGDWENDLKNSSKVVDANGEPLAVFHGGTFSADEIPNAGMHFGTLESARERARDYAIARQEAKRAGGNVSTGEITETAAFLNIRNPKTVEDQGTREQWEAAREAAETVGTDGLSYVNRAEDYGSTSYVAFSPEQIKSATANAGTYGGENLSILFQADLLEEAARYDTWEEFRDAYEENAGPADNAWYKTFWEDARIAAGTEGEARFQSDAETADEAFVNDLDRETIQEAVLEIWNTYAAQMTEPAEGEDRSGYDRSRGIKARMERGELPDREKWMITGSKLLGGGELSKSDYNMLRSLIREAPRDYRALFADLLDRPEWGMDLADMKDGEPAARLADPVRGGEEGFDKERLERIAGDIDDPELAAGVRDGSITFDDPRIQIYGKGLDEGLLLGKRALEKMDGETKEDYARLLRLGSRQLADLYRQFVAAGDKISDRRLNAERKRKAGELLTAKYQSDTRILEADYDNLYRLLVEEGIAGKLNTEVREAIARQEARITEMERQRALRLRRRAVSELKRIKQGLVKRVMRKVSYATVAFTEAKAIKIVQTFFEPSLIAGIHKWAGGLRGPALQKIWYKWQNNVDFRDSLTKADKSRKIQQVLDKEWDFITKSEKENLIRLLPKKDWVAELNLEAFIEDLENSIQLDTKEVTGADGQTYIVLGEEEDRIAREALGEELYARIQNKSFADWNILEMAELAEVVDDLYNEGRQNKRAVEEAKIQQRNRYQNLMADALRLTRIQINDDDSEEEKAQKRVEISKILNRHNFGMAGTAAREARKNAFLNRIANGNHFGTNVRRVARILDNGKDGIFTNLLYWQENDAFNKRERAIRDRTFRANKSMKALGIKLDELMQKVTVSNFWADGSALDLSIEELLGIKLASRDELSRRAVVYGNMLKEGERNRYKINPDAKIEQWLADTAEGRFTKVEQVSDEFFSREENKKFLTLMEGIARDYDNSFARLNQTNINVFNQPVFKVEHYFPMYRLETSGDPNNNQIINDLIGLAGVSTQWTDRGMTQNRIEMRPENQTGIQLGLYSTWAKSVQKVEHFIGYAEYVKSLNSVFKSRSGGAVSESISSRYGDGMIQYINEYINEVANPESLRRHDTLDNFVRMMRGKTAAAYLGWKVSGILKQAVTSPWPYLQYMNPAEYTAALTKFMAHPVDTWEFIREKSVFMDTRQADLMLAVIKEQQEASANKGKGILNKITKTGMKGLELIDRAAVAPGWMVIYERETARMEREGKLGASVIEEEAVRIADDVVRKTQPSSRLTDLAPMFKRGNAFVQAYLQFQSALNVIWQNIRYDLPDAVRNRQWGQVVGTVAGYALAGISLYMLTVGIFGGDDDDEKKQLALWQKIAYGSTTQFTDSVPIIGDWATTIVEGTITGRWRMPYDTNLLPVGKDVYDALAASVKAGQALSADDTEKAQRLALKAAAEFESAIGMALGFPQSAIGEFGRGLGIGDGDGEFEFNIGAFAGRRK
ncbi:MAG: hypothetical protein LBI67_11995 [Treponema sp.]|jgi:hypothetical protein|nr:hypothetical protein [Treponema sp.]